jgi:hypothetical protein
MNTKNTHTTPLHVTNPNRTVIMIENNSQTKTPTDFPQQDFNPGYNSGQNIYGHGDTGISIAPDLHHRGHQSNSYVQPALQPVAEMQKSRLRNMIEMAQCCMGIYVSFVVLSFFQEKITRRPYGSGENESHFNFPLFLVFLQCMCNCATAYGSMFLFTFILKI